jgi:hypothetical protein
VVDSKDRVGEGAAWTQRGAWLGSKTGRGVNRLSIMDYAQLLWSLSIC